MFKTKKFFLNYFYIFYFFIFLFLFLFYFILFYFFFHFILFKDQKLLIENIFILKNIVSKFNYKFHLKKITILLLFKFIL